MDSIFHDVVGGELMLLTSNMDALLVMLLHAAHVLMYDLQRMLLHDLQWLDVKVARYAGHRYVATHLHAVNNGKEENVIECHH